MGMFAGVALGITPRMPMEWRLFGLTLFLVSVVPAIISAIKNRRGGAAIDDAACLTGDQSGEASSGDGSDH